MKTVRINKGELVEIVTNNRKNHRSEWEKAFEGYRETCVKALHNALDSIKVGNKVQVQVYEEMPEDHTADYDVALKMLNMSVDTVIELTNQEFRQLVNDDWEWQNRFKAASSKYLGR